MIAWHRLDVDYPTRDDRPGLVAFEIRDAILRLANNGAAVYEGLGACVEDFEPVQEAHARTHRWAAWRARLVRMAVRVQWAGGHVPPHTCVYWRTQEGVCSMCNTRIVPQAEGRA